MLSHEKNEFVTEMNLKWPEKFTESDLEYWVKKLSDFPFADVMESLSAFKAEARFAPKISEILERLNAKGIKRSQIPSKWKTIVAEAMVRANPWMDKEPETAIILHYHRYWFLRYRKSNLIEGEHAASALAQDRLKAIEERRESVRQCCIRDLRSVCSVESAEALAQWFDASQSDYRRAIDDLRNGLVEPEAVPEFA